MSSLVKLGIQGIRSFSPEEMEVIEFARPLTVICGANGCGKTTIIECLRYATTGQMPPGADHGKSFVHDLRIADRREVKGTIKLKFRNRVPNTMVAQRNLQVTSGRNHEPKFQALDAALILKDRDPVTGEVYERTMTMKPTQMDLEMPTMLDVPRAVLDHVIFCHQEDSNWPLQEGKVLKERFDQIFESTRYVKALEEVKNQKKEREKQRASVEITVAASEGNMKRVRDLKGSVKKHEEDLQRAEKELQQLSEQAENWEAIVNGLREDKQAIEAARSRVGSATASIRGQEETLRGIEGRLASLNPDERAVVDEMKGMTVDAFRTAAQLLQQKVEAADKELGEAKRVTEAATTKKDELERRRDGMRGALDARKRAETERDVARADLRAATAAAQRELHAYDFAVPAADPTVEQVLAALTSVRDVVRSRQSALETSRLPEVHAAKAAECKGNQQAIQEEVAARNLKSAVLEASTARHNAVSALRSGGSGVDPVEALSNAQRRVDTASQALKEAEAQLHRLQPQLGTTESKAKVLAEEVERLRRDHSSVLTELTSRATGDAALRQAAKDAAEADTRYASIRQQVQAILGSCPTAPSVGAALAAHIGELQSQAARDKLTTDSARVRAGDAEVTYRDALRAVGKALIAAKDAALRWTDDPVVDLWQKLRLSSFTEQARGWLDRLSSHYELGLGEAEWEKAVEAKGLHTFMPPAHTLPPVDSLEASIAAIQEANRIFSQEDLSAEAGLMDFFSTAREHLDTNHSCVMCGRPGAAAELDKMRTQLSELLKACGGLRNARQNAAKTGNAVVIALVEDGLREGSEELNLARDERNMYLEKARNMKAVVEGYHTAVARLSSAAVNLTGLRKTWEGAQAALTTAVRAADVIAKKAEAVQDVQAVAMDVSAYASKAERVRAEHGAYAGQAVGSASADLQARSSHLAAELAKKEQQLRAANDEKDDLAQQVSEQSRKSTGASSQLAAATNEAANAKAEAVRRGDLAAREAATKEKEASVMAQQQQAEERHRVARIIADAAASRLSELSSAYNQEKQALDDAERRLKERIPSINVIGNRLVKAENDIRTADRGGASNHQAAFEQVQALIVSADEELRASRVRERQSEVDAKRFNAPRRHIDTLENIHLARQTIAKKREELAKETASMDAVALRLLRDDTFRAACEANDLDLSAVDGFNTTAGGGQDRARQRRTAGGNGADEDMEVEIVEDPSSVPASSSKRQRVPQSVGPDELVRRAMELFSGKAQTVRLRNAEQKGAIRQIRAAKLRLDGDLRAPELRTAESEYTTSLSELTVLEAACKDLDVFHSALDKALMSFHSMKIKEINSTIGELWSLTYKGGDIDKIEIRSTEDADGTGVGMAVAAPTGKAGSRSYNYRVVMTKCGAEMDMRGRCSAGQKVLASIVIRLALAESFCVNTGILALDEPTTNLDDPNRKGLAQALANIIEMRGNQLQLIVITHDEEFVRELGRGATGGGSSSENHVGKFYRVTREDIGDGVLSRSRITRFNPSEYLAVAPGDEE